MRTIVLLIAAAVMAFPAEAADLPVPGKPPVQGTSAPTKNIFTYGNSNPSCQVWTDGCRRCERAGGAPNCSNIGIACQPGAVRCAEPK